MNHVTRRALARAEEELLPRPRVPGGLRIERGYIERSQPSSQPSQLALWQLERGHAARGAALDQVVDLRFAPGAQAAIVHQRRRPVPAVSTLAVASFAEVFELLSCRSKSEAGAAGVCAMPCAANEAVISAPAMFLVIAYPDHLSTAVVMRTVRC